MNKPRLYWDSSIFLSILNNEAARWKVCEDILQQAKMEKVHIVTSTYTIVEVIRPKRQLKLTPKQSQKIKDMFRWSFLTTIELDERTANYASDLARAYNLKPADSVHAASAILWKAEELQAWDRDFSSVSHLITTVEPRYLSVQPSLEGMEPARISPPPEDFEKDEK